MKEKWQEPRILVQQFMANEYVSACGDSGKTYNFVCNAGNPGDHYDVITEKGENLTPDQLDYLGRKTIVGYHPCGETHQAPVNDEFINGFIVYDNGDDRYIGGSSRERVIIWTNHGTNVHCTTDLDINSLTVDRS